MTEIWKKLETDDKREFLYAVYKVANIGEANRKAQLVIPIIIEHNIAEESEISITSDRLRIVLHGHSKDSISQKDWAITEEMQEALK